ncbi:MAG: HAMP domain-containing protein [Hyphomicrobiaceae bacterium]|nr:HAMP domain-containing protein [Hyphomicrobiaceae bacterium]
MMARIRDWFERSLSRKLYFVLGATMTGISLAFLVLFVGYYRGRLIAARATTSSEINAMLQVALENAMLKRDIPGLQGIVAKLGEKKNVRGVMILNPEGEVRFSAPKTQLGRMLDLHSEGFCLGCDVRKGGTSAAMFVSDPEAGEVLRSVKSVANHEPCTQCHGKVSEHPVNGILVVDYDAGEIRREALTMGLLLAGSGILVLLAGSGAIGLALRRSVIRPVQELSKASSMLADGHFDAVDEPQGDDELAELARTFRTTSRKLEANQIELAERETFLQSMIDAMPDGVRVIAPDYSVLKVNKAFSRQIGLAPEVILGRPCYASSHARTEPCAPTLVTCPLYEIGRNGAALTCRHTHKNRDGQDVLVEVSAAPLELHTGTQKRVGVVEAIRDLSGDIQHSHEQRLSEIGHLAAGVAHEIRNPLSSIHLTLQAVRDRPNNDMRDDFSDHLDVMETEIDRCIQVTERLLKLSAPASELPELVAIDEVIPEVVSLLNAEASNAEIAMQLELSPSLRVIAADGDIRMLVFNIVQNAFHAMPAGGTMTIKGYVADDQVVIEFRDTGTGIPPEDMQRIFQPFWSRRADGAHGTGLGLPICREIVRRHGGSIRAENSSGHGANFIVTLPWAEADTEET